jgi:hypothetical protein
VRLELVEKSLHLRTEAPKRWPLFPESWSASQSPAKQTASGRLKHGELHSHGIGRGRAAPLHENVLFAAMPDDVPNDQEVARQL